MSSAIGHRMLEGGAIQYHRGNGLGRAIASKAFESLANAVTSTAVGKLAQKIKADGIRITGGKRKPGRPRRVGRPKNR